MTISQIGNKRKELGFTLLEAIAVLAIIVIFTTVTSLFFTTFLERTKLATAARSVTSALRTARGYAIGHNEEHAVVFDITVTPNEYYIYDGSNVVEKEYKLPTGIWFYDPNAGTDGIGFTRAVDTHKAGFFKPIGALDEAGDRTIYVADGTTTGASSKSITVERTTGRVKIE